MYVHPQEDTNPNPNLNPNPNEVGEECTFVGLPKQDAALPFFQDCVVREA